MLAFYTHPPYQIWCRHSRSFHLRRSRGTRRRRHSPRTYSNNTLRDEVYTRMQLFLRERPSRIMAREFLMFGPEYIVKHKRAAIIRSRFAASRIVFFFNINTRTSHILSSTFKTIIRSTRYMAVYKSPFSIVGFESKDHSQC